MKKVVIGDATLYLGDCMDIMPTLGKFHAIVTDPPYGIGEAAGKNKSRDNLAISKDYGNKQWDNEPPYKFIEWLNTWTGSKIVFGGNYFNLPPTSCWLLWDKENGATDFADVEMAWTNLKSAVRLKKYMWNGMLRANKETRGDHPTQKPIGIMKWCITKLPETDIIICDPFMGSGTTGVACLQLGRKFIGIEEDLEYFEIACQRIQREYDQLKLF